MLRNILEKAWKGILFFIVAFFPFAFNPFMLDSTGNGKQLFLWLGIGLVAILWGVDTILSKEKKIVWNSFLTWWGMMIGVAFVSMLGISSSGTRLKSVYFSWGVGSMFVLFLAWILVLQAGSSFLSKLLIVWKSVAMFVCLFSLVILLVPSSKLPLFFPDNENPLISVGIGFSLFGNLLQEIMFLIVMGVVACLRLRGSYKREGKYLHWSGVVFVFLIGIFVDVYRIYKSPLFFLDIRNTWTILTESLKVHPWVGLGVGNFVEGFLKYRNIEFNNTNNWVSVFNIAPSGAMQWVIETGIFGLIVFLIGAIKGLKGLIKKRQIWLLCVVILVFALPWNLVSIFVFGILLFLDRSRNVIVENRYIKILIGPFGLGLGMLLLGFGVKPTMAEMYWKKSFVMAGKNDGNGVYVNQQKAISLFTENPDYHRGFSQTNFDLAKKIIASNSLEKELSEETRQSVSTLIGQAVSEGKTAVGLESNISTNWENLASIYKSLIGIVDGSYDWAMQAYIQTARLNPVNPDFRIEMGGLYYGVGDFENATKEFSEAVRLKPDYANAWYNLAWSIYNQAQMGKQNMSIYTQKLNMAISSMQQALSGTEVGSTYFEKANKEMDKWKEELANVQKDKAVDADSEIMVGKEEKVNVPGYKLEP